MAKKTHKKAGKMPMHTFTLTKDHTHDRFYKRGEKIHLNDETTVTNLLNNKIIK